MWYIEAIYHSIDILNFDLHSTVSIETYITWRNAIHMAKYIHDCVLVPAFSL